MFENPFKEKEENQEEKNFQGELFKSHFDHVERQKSLYYNQISLMEKLERFLISEEFKDRERKDSFKKKSEIYTLESNGTRLDSEGFNYISIVCREETPLVLTLDSFEWEVVGGVTPTKLPCFDGLKIQAKSKQKETVLMLFSRDEL